MDCSALRSLQYIEPGSCFNTGNWCFAIATKFYKNVAGTVCYFADGNKFNLCEHIHQTLVHGYLLDIYVTRYNYLQ